MKRQLGKSNSSQAMQRGGGRNTDATSAHFSNQLVAPQRVTLFATTGIRWLWQACCIAPWTAVVLALLSCAATCVVQSLA